MDVAADIGIEAPARDDRFRRLLGEANWSRLPAPVQARFSKSLAHGRTVVYAGEVVAVRANLAGRLLAQFARLIGGPLPLVRDAPTTSIVTVTQDDAGAQHWNRLYARRIGFPQIIQSSKQFEGTTGLEEHVGSGVGMALKVSVEDAALVFRSAFYFVAIGERRIRVPRLFEPGRITVTHAELGGGRFSFSLDVRHPLFGRLLMQHAVFREDIPC